MPIENHDTPVPDICDICKYVVEHPANDLRYEHGLVNIASALLISELIDAGGPLPLGAFAVHSIGVEPGPVHYPQPRHWFWALWAERDILLSLRSEVDR